MFIVLVWFPGRHYYEIKVTDEGLCRVGWSTMNAGYDLGTDKEGFGFGGTGKMSHGRQFDSYGEVEGRKAYRVQYRPLLDLYSVISI